MHSRTFIRLPLYNPYYLSYVHPLTEEKLNIKTPVYERECPKIYAKLEIDAKGDKLENGE